ncbi:hypothetical protein BZA70DRAFT_269208 [Myxozyma melibiosi]|uniref:Uncharacterized protein n=1 Tax=Myxozyma melibiosi TaxID=54550 RepID=A0ABR1F0P5_9ASCO
MAEDKKKLLELPRSNATNGPLNLKIAQARAVEYYPGYEVSERILYTMIDLREVITPLSEIVAEVPRQVHIVGSKQLYRQIKDTVCSGHNVMMNGHYLFEGVRVVLDDRIQGLVLNNTGRVHQAGSRLAERLKTAILANANAAAQHDLQYRVYTGSPIVYSIKHGDGNEWIRPDQVLGLVDDMLSVSRPVWAAILLVGYSDDGDQLRESARAFLIPPQDEEPERVDMVILVDVPYHQEYETLDDLPEYVDVSYYMRNSECTTIEKVYQARVSKLDPVIAFDLAYMGINTTETTVDDALRQLESEADEPGRSIRMSPEEEKYPGEWMIRHSTSARVTVDRTLVNSWLEDVFEERRVEASVFYEEQRMANRSCTIV